MGTTMFSFFLYTFTTLFIIVCLFLVLLVLIQKGRGGGLASAFGGAGGNTAFGSKTGDVLTWATSIVFGIFLVLAITLNRMAAYHAKSVPSSIPTRSAPPSSPNPNPIPGQPVEK
jgi:preprotein translocase subunit SecG